MMHLNAQWVQDLFIAIAFIGGTFAIYKVSKASRLPSETIKNLKESNASLITLDETRQREMEKLKEEVHETNASHAREVLQLNKDISELQGQIKVYKELPLRELADGIKEVVKTSRDNANSIQKILETLQVTVNINAEDRDTLTNQNKHIRTEVHKVINEDTKVKQ